MARSGAERKTRQREPAPSPLIVLMMPGFRPAALALMAEAEPPKVFACIARALEDLNKT
jgi:hypothetical protein